MQEGVDRLKGVAESSKSRFLAPGSGMKTLETNSALQVRPDAFPESIEKGFDTFFSWRFPH